MSRIHAYAAAKANQNHESNKITKVFKDKISNLNKKLLSTGNQLIVNHEQSVPERLSIIKAVERAICQPGKSRLIKFGSLCTNLIVDNSSDIDLCFLPEDKSFFEDFHKCPDFKQ